jgi:hypothetical protein
LAAIPPQRLATAQTNALHFNGLEPFAPLSAVRQQARTAGEHGQNHDRQGDNICHFADFSSDGKSPGRNRRFEADSG